MNPEIFAEWYRRQGYDVFRTESTYWFKHGPRAYQAAPFHWVVSPSDDELKEIFKARGVLALRYSTPLSASSGALSYHTVYEMAEYNFDSLGKWARKNVKRGLKNCVVEPVPFERIAEEGWELQTSTLQRQGRSIHLGHEAWRNRFLSAKDLPGFEAWGAIVNGTLAASVLTFQMEDCCYMLYQQCREEYLREHVNNALSFTVSGIMMERNAIKSIFYSLHSLDAPMGIDEFKFRMGYSAKAVRQRVVFHPVLAPLVNPVSSSILRAVHRLLPSNGLIAKAEGLARFYLQGKLPLEKQPPIPALTNT